MKKLLVNLSVTLLAASLLTACAGASSGRGTAEPDDAAPEMAETVVSATPAPTAAPTPEPEPMVLAWVETHPDPMASMEGETIPDSWTEKLYTPEGLLAEELTGPMEGTADTRVAYSYDDRGFLTQEVHSSLVDGAWMVESTVDYANDDHGNPLTKTTTSGSGFQQVQSFTYEYDESGRWIRRDWGDPTFPMWDVREYTGDGQACTEYLYYPGEKLRMVSTYDDAGRVLREEDMDNGEVVGFRQYTYDEQGGLICITADYDTDNLPVLDLWKYTNTYEPLSQALVQAAEE